MPIPHVDSDTAARLYRHNVLPLLPDASGAQRRLQWGLSFILLWFEPLELEG